VLRAVADVATVITVVAAVWWVWWEAMESGPRGRELVLLGKLAFSFSSALRANTDHNMGDVSKGVNTDVCL
jgi:hypothetical protein